MFLGIFLNKFFCCRTKYGHDRIFLRKKEKILIKVAVTGALGKMGREVISMTLADENLDLVLALDVVGEGEKISPPTTPPVRTMSGPRLTPTKSSSAIS